MTFRTEHDSMGEVRVPADALYAAQTQRAVDNFPISGIRFSRTFIRALALVKGAAAAANEQLGYLEKPMAEAIERAAAEVADGQHDDHFPVDIFQTGSGTSTNMNANEVIAALANKSGDLQIHPNDHVNASQSSNDVIPTAIHVAAALELNELLLPALQELESTLEKRASETDEVVKTGRTHLMDAMPIRLSQELRGWASQIHAARQRITYSSPSLYNLALGGTAVGTGINASAEFGGRAAAILKEKTSIDFTEASDHFAAQSAMDAAVEMSGQLKTLASALFKIANDLRWMNSGPQAGLGEIALPSLQPGSSIMPGKVNPVIPEATMMACAQVMGNDATITFSNASGNFQLNVMLPVIAHNLLQSIHILGNATKVLSEKAIAGFEVKEDAMRELVAKNPIMVTVLNPIIGYEKGAAIAKRAYKEERKLIDVALEETDLSREELEKLLDPQPMTEGGIVGD